MDWEWGHNEEDEEYTYRILMGKSLGKRSLRRYGRRWEDTITDMG
jgi:hypothetical protein